MLSIKSIEIKVQMRTFFCLTQISKRLYLDGYIILENYLEFCASGKIVDNFNIFSQNENKQRTHFQLMDSKGQGHINWSEFALFYTGKLLSNKNRVMSFLRNHFD